MDCASQALFKIKMKTIKELEKTQKLFKENHGKENPVIQIRIEALKDVLKLIDELAKKYDCIPIINTFVKALKQKIQGENGNTN